MNIGKAVKTPGVPAKPNCRLAALIGMCARAAGLGTKVHP